MANGWLLQQGARWSIRLRLAGGMVVAYELWPCQPDCSPQMLNIG